MSSKYAIKRSNSRNSSRKLVRTVTIDTNRRAPSNRYKIYAALNDKTIYTFKRITNQRFVLNNSTGFAGSTAFGMSINFQLDNIVSKFGATVSTNAIPSASEFVALFDQWRIKEVLVRVGFSNNVSTTASLTTTLPTVYVAEDSDGVGAVTTVAEIQQKQGVRVWQLGSNGTSDNYRTIIIHPKPASAVYQGGAFSGYSEVPKNYWLDCAYPAIENYGLRIAWDRDNTTATDIGYMNVVYECIFEFRGVQ